MYIVYKLNRRYKLFEPNGVVHPSLRPDLPGMPRRKTGKEEAKETLDFIKRMESGERMESGGGIPIDPNVLKRVESDGIAINLKPMHIEY
jgi:hypothetical protein